MITQGPGKGSEEMPQEKFQPLQKWGEQAVLSDFPLLQELNMPSPFPAQEYC